MAHKPDNCPDCREKLEQICEFIDEFVQKALGPDSGFVLVGKGGDGETGLFLSNIEDTKEVALILSRTTTKVLLSPEVETLKAQMEAEEATKQ